MAASCGGVHREVMTTLEAVEALSGRARRLASHLNLLAGAAVVVVAVAGTGVGVVAQWAFFARASVWAAAAFGMLVSLGVVVPTSRFLIKRTIALRRTAWIEETARAEGLSAEELARYFTLDSW